MLQKVLAVILVIACLTVSSVFADDATLDVLVYDSYAVSEDLVAAFESANQVRLQFIEAGDGTELLNRAILTKNAPLADVILGINSVLVARALENDLLEPYAAPALDSIDDKFKVDAENRALPFDHAGICLNYDTAYFETNGLDVPASLEELADPKYKGMLAIESPVSSTPGLAFMLLTVDVFGEDGFLDYWNSLVENGAEIVPDWSTAYYTNFTAGGGDGHQPMVVSYDASPAAAPFYADEPMEKAPTAAIVADKTCFNMIEYIGILKGTDQAALARKFVDAVLSPEWQSDLPGQMFVYPVNSEATVPELFETFAPVPRNPVMMDPALVAASFEKWLQLWSASVQLNP